MQLALTCLSKQDNKTLSDPAEHPFVCPLPANIFNCFVFLSEFRYLKSSQEIQLGFKLL